MQKVLIALIVGATALSALPAFATGEIVGLMTDNDKARLEKFQETKADAIVDAHHNGAPDDLAVLDQTLAKPTISFDGFDMTGNWQCRTTKVGGLASLVIYGWFRCKVTDDGSGWRLEKLSGSQRTTGRFFTESDTALTYLGSYYVAGDAVPKYGAGPDSDQVGRAFRTGSEEWRIEFPAPRYESKLDILEFHR